MVADRRTALKAARELFDRGDRRGASKVLLDAGFSGSQIEAVFEGFLLEPAGGAKAPPRPPPARPPPPPPAREGVRERAPEPVRRGGGLAESLRRAHWLPVAAAGAVALVAALILLRPPAPGDGASPTPTPAVPTATPGPASDLGLPGVATAALEGCRWSDWTGDGAPDGVEASVVFRDGAGRSVAVNLPRGSFQVTAALTETVKRFRFDNVTGPRFETESRAMPASGADLLPLAGGWSLRLAADPAARAPLNFSDSATYFLAEELKTSVSRRLPGSCSF
ncbi:MAG: hypothetical protein QXT68_06585 [Halobacteria archaeon]